MTRIIGTDAPTETPEGTEGNDFFDGKEGRNKIFTLGGNDTILISPSSQGEIIEDFSSAHDTLVFNGFPTLRTFEDLEPLIRRYDNRTLIKGDDLTVGLIGPLPLDLNEHNVLFNRDVQDPLAKVKVIPLEPIFEVPDPDPERSLTDFVRFDATDRFSVYDVVERSNVTPDTVDLAGVSETGDFGGF